MLSARRVASALVRQRRIAFVAWALIAATVIPQSIGVEQRLETRSRVAGSDSERVAEMMASRFASSFARYAILVVTGIREPQRGAGRTALSAIVAALDSSAAVAGTFSVLDAPDSLFIGRHGGTFIVVGLHHADADLELQLAALRGITRALLARLRLAHPELELLWTGEHPLTADLRSVSADDASRAERRVLPLTLALLVLAFGAIAAAVLPIGLGVLAIAITLGLLSLVALALTVSILVLNVATMLGLGLGIDYALLMVSRFREARGRGLGVEDAAVEAAMHAGRSVVLSGAAVLVGFLALLSVPLDDIRSIAVGGALVTAVSVLLATTLMPGVLAALGTRIEWGRVRRGASASRGADGWRTWSLAVVRHPLRVLLVAGPLIGALAWQWRSLETHTPDGDWLPASAESARGLRALRAMERSGVVYGIRVIVDLPPGSDALSPAAWQGVARLTSILEHHPGVGRVRSLPGLVPGTPQSIAMALLPRSVVAGFVSDDSRLALLDVVPRESAGIADAMALVRDLRELDAAGITGLDGARLVVGGLPAFNVDYGDTIVGATPRVVMLVVGATFLAFLIAFRSVLVALKTVVLNLATVAAAFGAVVLVFQRGVGASALGLADPLDGVFPAVPLLVFCIVFGLSMDYEVFLVARVAEARRAGADDGEAIVEGVTRTGGVITSAGLIMITVFGAFVMSEFVFMKILGFALTVAIALDVTLVRLALGPALLRLAGRWNWWPGDRIPRASPHPPRRHAAIGDDPVPARPVPRRATPR
jgi:RND superfamily putative drug exporter